MRKRLTIRRKSRKRRASAALLARLALVTAGAALAGTLVWPSVAARAAYEDLVDGEQQAIRRALELVPGRRLHTVTDCDTTGRVKLSQTCWYNPDGTLHAVMDDAQPLSAGTVYEYDATGLRNVTVYNGKGYYHRTHYDYNSQGQIVRRGYSNSNEPYANDVYDTVEYDRNGRMSRIVDQAETKGKQEFFYDEGGRLTDVLNEDVSGAAYSETQYVYDAAGRLVQKRFVPDVQHKNYSAIVEANYGYDADGLLTEIHYYPTAFNLQAYTTLLGYE